MTTKLLAKLALKIICATIMSTVGINSLRVGQAQVLSSDFNNVDYLIKMGDAASGVGYHRNAIKYYSEALAKNPRQADVYLKRCIAYGRIVESEKAIIDCSRAIKLNKILDQAYSQRCSLYSSKYQFERALDDCSVAVALNPENRFARAYLDNLGYLESVLNYFQTLAKKYPNARYSNSGSNSNGVIPEPSQNFMDDYDQWRREHFNIQICGFRHDC